jgi:hypothetical protein
VIEVLLGSVVAVADILSGMPHGGGHEGSEGREGYDANSNFS